MVACQEIQLVYIIRGMHKDETIDIYEKLPANIVLLRATVPQVWADYRDKTVNVLKRKRTVKVIPDTTHMLHWDKPEIVIAEIKIIELTYSY